MKRSAKYELMYKIGNILQATTWPKYISQHQQKAQLFITCSDKAPPLFPRFKSEKILVQNNAKEINEVHK